MDYSNILKEFVKMSTSLPKTRFYTLCFIAFMFAFGYFVRGLPALIEVLK